MIFQESFRFFTYFDAIEMGLYFVIVGYDFLLFAYFLFMRWRTSKKSYWFFFFQFYFYVWLVQEYFSSYIIFFYQNSRIS